LHFQQKEVFILSKYRFQNQGDSTRVNFQIRVPQVRVISPEGESLGILTVPDAVARAEARGLDLVEVAPNASPPVCRIMDYGKFKYEKSKKQKEAKKKQHVAHLKEIKLHPKIDDHDYQFKVRHARDFLIKGDRVKCTIVFRGREIMHIEFGERVLRRFEQDMADLAILEQSGKREGRNLISMFIAEKVKVKEYLRKAERERKEAEQRELREQQLGLSAETESAEPSPPQLEEGPK
jgi:translation initiation factor IF-3